MSSTKSCAASAATSALPRASANCNRSAAIVACERGSGVSRGRPVWKRPVEVEVEVCLVRCGTKRVVKRGPLQLVNKCLHRSQPSSHLWLDRSLLDHNAFT